MNSISNETIKNALDHNDQEAWETIEEQLFRHFPEQENKVTEFLDQLHEVATSDNYPTYEEIRDELAFQVDYATIAHTQVISLNPEEYNGPSQEVMNAHFTINYDQKMVYATLEKVNKKGLESDFFDFHMDGTTFWEYLEIISDEDEPEILLIEELDAAVLNGFEIVAIDDDEDVIYVDREVSELFKKIEEAIDDNRNFGADYILTGYYVYHINLADLHGPLYSANLISDDNEIELLFSNISKYDVTIRSVVKRSNRTQQVAVTTINEEVTGLYLKTADNFVFFEYKI